MRKHDAQGIACATLRDFDDKSPLTKAEWRVLFTLHLARKRELDTAPNSAGPKPAPVTVAPITICVAPTSDQSFTII